MLGAMRRGSRTALAAALASLLLAAPTAFAADGDLDATYAFDGIRNLERGADADIALLPDGGLVAATEVPGGDSDGILAKLTPTGSLNGDFGGDGFVGVSTPGGMNLSAIAVQPDGRIVVAGTADQTESANVIVLRFLADGTPDESFDGDGRVLFDYNGVASSASSLLLQPDGRIVVAGGTGTDFAAARLMPDGGFDSSFSGDGRTVEDLGSASESANAAVLQGGRIVLAGASGDQFAALRLNADGTRDAGFGTGGDGRVLVAMGAGSGAFDAIVTPDGGLLLAGVAHGADTGDDMGALKLDAAGAPDRAFSADGVQFIDFQAATNEGALAAATTVDGKLALAGRTAGGLAVAKLTQGGQLDPSFAGGRRTYGGMTFGGALLRQADGKLLIGGSDGAGGAIGRIDDSLPVADLQAGAVSEGEVLPFTVALNKASGFPITVDYTTGDGTAERGRDYVGRSGTLTIPPGALFATISVSTLLDRLFENDEQFRVELSNLTNATYDTQIKNGTIRNRLRPGRCANVLIGAGRTDLLSGSPAGDRIVGRDDQDLISGLAGDDCLYGEAGSDEIYGGDGNDKLNGASGNDRLHGGDGNDKLIGGRGRNRYDGGPGDDRIYARNGRSEIVECGPGRDTVKVDLKDRLRR